MNNYFLARQPIYDRQLKVMGYELLYRKQEVNTAQIANRDLATTQVILNAFAESGIDRIVGSRKSFINLTDNFILGKYPLPFSPEHTILEVPEDMEMTRQNILGLRLLASRGFKLALDDVVDMNVQPLLDLATYVKVDLIGTNPQRLISLVNALQNYPVRLLAEKVETQADFSLCMRLGFQYFQGYFLCKPKISSGRLIDPNRAVLLNLLAAIYQPDVSISYLEGIVAQDVSLGYKILRLVNSAHYGLRRQVQSIHQAIALIGLDALRGWLTLFMLSNTIDKPPELTTIAMMRAKMCAQLAQQTGQGNSSTFFLTGLLSVLDALMDLSMPQILESIPLSNEITNALCRGTGNLGQALQCVQAYERADWNSVRFSSLSTDQIRDIYLGSMDWAEGINRAIYNSTSS